LPGRPDEQAPIERAARNAAQVNFMPDECRDSPEKIQRKARPGPTANFDAKA
jgi:hypothetical protein